MFDDTTGLLTKPSDIPLGIDSHPIARVLWDAANYIEEHGWCQNRLTDVRGRVCFQGALGKAIDPAVDLTAWRKPAQWPHWGLARDANMAFIRHLGLSASKDETYLWNDAPDRTQEEVVTALRDCARSLLEKRA